MDSDNLIDLSFEHVRKAMSPIDAMESGNVIDSRLVQPEKACFPPMDVMESGSSTVFS